MEDFSVWLTVITLLFAIAGPIVGFVVRSLNARIDKLDARLIEVDKEGRDRTAKTYDRIEEIDDKVAGAKDSFHGSVVEIHKGMGDLKQQVAERQPR
jgi:predicted PurR-regulated permease PerM